MFRIRLRTFLMVFTLICLVLGWRVSAVERFERPVRALWDLGWELGYPSETIAVSGGKQENLPQRGYFQMLLLGCRRYDMPTAVLLPEWSEISTPDEVERLVRQSAGWINRLPTLEIVDLSECPLTTPSVKPLIRCTNIRLLSFHATDLDDSSLEDLAQLTHLETLNLWSTKISVQGADELRRRVPNCKVIHSYREN